MMKKRYSWLRLPRTPLRRNLYILLSAVSLLVCLTATPSLSLSSPPSAQSQQAISRPLLAATLDSSRQLYEEGRYAEAAQILEQTARQAQEQGDGRGEAIAQRNLSLVLQQLGQWDAAETAIQRSLELLQSAELSGETAILAQTLDVLGRLQLYRGLGEAALATWEQSQGLYEQLGDGERAVQARLNQAEAMQSLGLYRRAIQTMTELREDFDEQLDSPQQVILLQRLGNALRVAGDLPQAATVLQESLEMAQRLPLREAIASIYLSLGNTAYASGQLNQAALFYQQAALEATDPALQIRADLNQLRVLIDQGAFDTASAAIPSLTRRLEALPTSRLSVYGRVNLGESVLRLQQQDPTVGDRLDLAQTLTVAIQQAEALQDRQAASYAYGTLGKLYEQANQWADAKQLTDRALVLAQQADVPELRYLWEWQLGRILKGQGDRDGAIAAYSSTITSLQAVRRDLAGINPEAQFSFRDSVEPIHRELVALLLDPNQEPTQAELEQARFTIESLQLAELDNFFREACLNAREVQIDEIDRQAAVLYPILLSDRLSVVLSLPEQPLQHYFTTLSDQTVNTAVNVFLESLRTPTSGNRVEVQSKQLYDWLIAPVRDQLDASEIRTIVFVPDGILRSIPMAALYDGDRYLIEDYSVALAPTLQLLEASQFQEGQLTALLGGLSEAREGFSSLPGVEAELNNLQSLVDARVIFNDTFTQEELASAVDDAPFPIIHLATHGVFGSTIDDTFILTWNGRLNINELSQLLQTADVSRRRPIELLVLSACQTAAGDDRATLGLAGVAVRSGARSTIASLWDVSDDATKLLMIRLYEELAKGNLTKAEALRRAQVSLITEDEMLLAARRRSIEVERAPQDSVAIAPTSLSHPYFWSAFVLVGNWL